MPDSKLFDDTAHNAYLHFGKQIETDVYGDIDSHWNRLCALADDYACMRQTKIDWEKILGEIEKLKLAGIPADKHRLSLDTIPPSSDEFLDCSSDDEKRKYINEKLKESLDWILEEQKQAYSMCRCVKDFDRLSSICYCMGLLEGELNRLKREQVFSNDRVLDAPGAAKLKSAREREMLKQLYFTYKPKSRSKNDLADQIKEHIQRDPKWAPFNVKKLSPATILSRLKEMNLSLSFSTQ